MTGMTFGLAVFALTMFAIVIAVQCSILLNNS